MTHFAALGGTRRRHVFSRAETRNYFCILFAILLFQEFTLTMFLKQEILDRKSAAILYYVMLSLILVFWFALFLPMQHLAKSFHRFPEFWTKYQAEGFKEFYVRKTVQEPRRERYEMNTINYECEAWCSYANKKQIGKKISKGHLHTIIEMPEIDI